MDIDLSPWLSHPIDHSMGEEQGDYHMTDGDHEGLSFSELPALVGDPLDFRFGASHMLILDGLSVAVHYYPSQTVNGLTVLDGSSRGPIHTNEISPYSRYWENLQNPQSLPPQQSNVVCPSPTHLPSRPNPVSQPGNHVEMVSAGSRHHPPATIPCHTHPIGHSGMNGPRLLLPAAECTEPPPPSCDHTTCYPPPDVGYLSRRFVENENWVRGRACAVASLVYRKRGFYSLPFEILEMIPEHFLTIHPLASLGDAVRPLHAWDRHMAYRVLAATSRRLRMVFYNRSWRTRVMREIDLPIMLKHIRVQVTAPFVERLVVELPEDPMNMELLRDCLLALPSLHTLEILNTYKTVTGVVKTVFKNKPDFPSIKKVTIPVTAHPILSRLPNLEDLACLRTRSRYPSVRPVLKSLRGPYVKERQGVVEPVLKSFMVVSDLREGKFAEALVKKLPRLRKVCLPEPSQEDMRELRDLKEIIELEILLRGETLRWLRPYDLDPIKALAIQILQASECHKDCVCKHECGCRETNECFNLKCNPPKRFLRVKTCPDSNYCTATKSIRVDEGSCIHNIEVSPRRVLSTK